MDLLILICFSFDGDTYKVFNIELIGDALEEFDKNIKLTLYHTVWLAKVKTGEDFGSDSRGEFYGGELLHDWKEDN